MGALDTLRSMADDGGRLVVTPASGPTQARTLIQLDGDILTFFTPEAIDDPALVAAHFDRVAAAITELGLLGTRLAKALQALTWSGPVLQAWLLAKDAIGDEPFSLGDALWQGGWGLLPASLSAAGLTLRAQARGTLKRKIRGRVKRSVKGWLGRLTGR